MDWGAVIWIILSILGAGFIAGGVVMYLKSKNPVVKAFGAAAVAMGVVMWAIVLFTLPVSQTGHPSPDPTVVTGN